MTDEREVQEVLAHYVRATDRRDGKAQGALFTDDAVVQIYAKTPSGDYEPVGGPLIGGSGVEYAVANFMPPHPPGGSSHHTTTDHLVQVDGDGAHLNAQFIVFEVRPGAIRPIESGYYDTELCRIDGGWKIVRHHVLMDVPVSR
ncbi:nuclear transport factor 2 family protein [Actinocrispum sp. NPDC049592]|uniref:nuclear transport factor 2 family protein n=1 Tax=Actinocrispum sp. NPDC049592 TaxID=3154835 RepID=UPI0034322BA0